MHKFRTVLFSSLILIGSQVAHLNFAQAEFYIEPFVGALVGGSSEGSVTLTAPASITASLDGDSSGTLFGARIGMEVLETLAVGATYEMGSIKNEYDSTLVNSDDLDVTSYGIFAAFEFPILLRVYGAYMLKSTGKDGSTEYSGNGTRFGVGFTGLPLVSVNLEMFSTKLDTVDATPSGTTITSLDVESKGFIIGVSLPLSF